jgi:hypothetical protein
MKAPRRAGRKKTAGKRDRGSHKQSKRATSGYGHGGFWLQLLPGCGAGRIRVEGVLSRSRHHPFFSLQRIFYSGVFEHLVPKWHVFNNGDLVPGLQSPE